MPEHSKLDLATEFPPVSTAEWEAVINADLKGADYEKKLVWRTEEGLKVKPYYRSEDIAGLEAQSDVAPGRVSLSLAARARGGSIRT